MKEKGLGWVSSTEKINTKKNLTRVTVKPLERDTEIHYKMCQLGDGNQITIEGPKVGGHNE